MTLQRVKSSSIAAVGYEPRQRTLVVQFQHGGTYAYFDVSRAIFSAFLRAPSLGRYFTSQIRGHYDYAELDLRRAPSSRRPGRGP